MGVTRKRSGIQNTCHTPVGLNATRPPRLCSPVMTLEMMSFQPTNRNIDETGRRSRHTNFTSWNERSNVRTTPTSMDAKR